MVKQFCGKTYELDMSSQQNLEALMDAIGVTEPTIRQAAFSLKARVTLTADGDKLTEVTQTGGHETSITFKLGEEFDEKTHDGVAIKSVVTQQGADTLVHVQKRSDGKTVTTEKKYSPDKLVTTITVGGVTGRRTYNAI